MKYCRKFLILENYDAIIILLLIWSNWETGFRMWFLLRIKKHLKLVSAIFHQFFIFNQMKALKKL